jgi:hypothetical protein
MTARVIPGPSPSALALKSNEEIAQQWLEDTTKGGRWKHGLMRTLKSIFPLSHAKYKYLLKSFLKVNEDSRGLPTVLQNAMLTQDGRRFRSLRPYEAIDGLASLASTQLDGRWHAQFLFVAFMPGVWIRPFKLYLKLTRLVEEPNGLQQDV